MRPDYNFMQMATRRKHLDAIPNIYEIGDGTEVFLTFKDAPDHVREAMAGEINHAILSDELNRKHGKLPDAEERPPLGDQFLSAFAQEWWQSMPEGDTAHLQVWHHVQLSALFSTQAKRESAEPQWTHLDALKNQVFGHMMGSLLT